MLAETCATLRADADGDADTDATARTRAPSDDDTMAQHHGADDGAKASANEAVVGHDVATHSRARGTPSNIPTADARADEALEKENDDADAACEKDAQTWEDDLMQYSLLQRLRALEEEKVLPALSAYERAKYRLGVKSARFQAFSSSRE